MNRIRTYFRALIWSALVLGTVAATPTAWAESPAEPADVDQADTRYLQDRIHCHQGPPGADKSACLRRAVASWNQAKRHASATTDERYQRNKLERCESLPDDLRTDCVARMHGEGTTTGSVAAGGIYRELVTRTPESSSEVKADGATANKPLR